MTRKNELRESEADFASWVEEMLQRFGYRVGHFRPAETKKGWRTAVSCDGKGFPDYVAIKGERQIVAEIKAQDGKPTAEQRDWLDSFNGVAETYLWRPADRDEIGQIILLGHTPNQIERLELETAWVNRRSK